MRYADIKRLLWLALLLVLAPFTQAQPETGTHSGVPSEAELAPESGDQGLLPLEELRTFTRVYDQIRNGYVEELSDATLLEFAIKGMIAELDPHSAFLDKKSFENLQSNTSGEFGGIGIEVGMEDGFVKVIAPIDDTPAERAGVQAGDMIIRLDDKPVKGMSLNEAVDLMRGPQGTELRITLVREGVEKPFEITLERDIIRVKSVRVELLEDAYAYIRIAQFQTATGADMQEALGALRAGHKDLKGMVLDLRNNPGGVLQSSVEVADTFLDEGLVVYTEGRLENSDMRYHANPDQVAAELPLVVLINAGSASASEIVAGALQDQGRAVVMGTRSFGKGSVQTILPVTDGRAIKLTTARYFTPSGRSIQAQGIVPDVTVERATVTAIKGATTTTEADLSGHLQNANGESNSEARRRSESGQNLAERDNQLQAAVNLLKGLHIFHRHQQAKITTRLPPVPENETGEEVPDGEQEPVPEEP